MSRTQYESKQECLEMFIFVVKLTSKNIKT